MTEEESTKYEDFIDDCIRLLSPDKIDGIMAKFREHVEYDTGEFLFSITNENGTSGVIEMLCCNSFDALHKYAYCECCDVVYMQYYENIVAITTYKEAYSHCCKCKKSWPTKRAETCPNCELENEMPVSEDVLERNLTHEYEQYDKLAEGIMALANSGHLRTLICEISELDVYNHCENFRLDINTSEITIRDLTTNIPTIYVYCRTCSKIYMSQSSSYAHNHHCCKCGNVWLSMEYSVREEDGTFVRKNTLWDCPNCVINNVQNVGLASKD